MTGLDVSIASVPGPLEQIEAATEGLGFSMASDRLIGSMLAALAASKPAARVLELGTGTGLATAWLLHGLDSSSQLLTVDNDEECLAVARRYLSDERLRIVCRDANDLLGSLSGEHFDLIFADAWVGKFERLDDVIDLLAPGGLYVIDDLLPQPNWPDGHAARVPVLLERLSAYRQLQLLPLAWSTGLIVAVRRSSS